MPVDAYDLSKLPPMLLGFTEFGDVGAPVGGKVLLVATYGKVIVGTGGQAPEVVVVGAGFLGAGGCAGEDGWEVLRAEVLRGWQRMSWCAKRVFGRSQTRNLWS